MYIYIRYFAVCSQCLSLHNLCPVAVALLHFFSIEPWHATGQAFTAQGLSRIFCTVAMATETRCAECQKLPRQHLPSLGWWGRVERLHPKCQCFIMFWLLECGYLHIYIYEFVWTQTMIDWLVASMIWSCVDRTTTRSTSEKSLVIFHYISAIYGSKLSCISWRVHSSRISHLTVVHSYRMV